MLSLFHEATTVHVRCAEHGELVHGSVETAQANVAAAFSAIGDLAGGAAQGHEHCKLACASRVASIQPPAFSLIAITTTTYSIEPAVVGVVDSHESLYRTAPKTSPPA